MAASGAPDRMDGHAINIADVSLQLISQVRSMILTSGIDIQIRIGKNGIKKIRELCSTATYEVKYFLLKEYILDQLSPVSLVLKCRGTVSSETL
jgi:hypothetical protein